MSNYTILKSNSSTITVSGSSINTLDTSLQLIGRAAKNYGSALNTNFLHLLENFSKNTAPTNPIVGQLWFNPSSNEMSVLNSVSAWVPIGGSGGAAPIFSESVIAISDPVIGFVHNAAIVGAFSNGNTPASNLPGILSATFSQGINRGLNIGNIDVAGVYGTSGLHFGLGNNPPVITVLTSITSIFGNLDIFSTSNVPNPSVNITAAGITGNNTFRFVAGSSGYSSILFTSNTNTGSIIQDHTSNSLGFTANKFEFVAANSSDTVIIKNNENLFVKLETLLGSENKIIYTVDQNYVYSVGLNNVGNYELTNETTNTPIMFVDTVTNNVGIKTNAPSVDFEVSGLVKIHGLTVSSQGTSYSLPVSSGNIGQVLRSNGDGNILDWQDLPGSSFIEDGVAAVGIFTELTPGELNFRTAGITQLVINAQGDVITTGAVTVSSITVNNPEGSYSLPLSAGLTGQVLISNGDGNILSWESVSGLAQSFIRNPAETVGFYSDIISENAVIQTNNENRLVITSDGKFGFNTDAPPASISLLASAGNYLDFKSLADEASFSVTTFNDVIFINVEGSAPTIKMSFKALNANLAGRARYTFFEDTNNLGNKEILFYQGVGSSDLDAKIGIDGRDSFFQLNGGKFGIGTDFPSEKLEVSGKVKARGIIVSSNSAFYILPTSSGNTNQYLQKSSNGQTVWASPYQSNEEGYIVTKIAEYKLSDVSVSAANWLFIPFDSVPYEKIIIRFNDINVSSNSLISDLRMRVLASSIPSFGSAYSSIGRYDTAFSQTNDAEWIFENFFSTVSGVFNSNIPSSFTSNIIFKGQNNPFAIDTHHTAFPSAGIRQLNLTSGFIPAASINDTVTGIILNASNHIKILNGWLTITGVLPKDTISLNNLPTITFTP